MSGITTRDFIYMDSDRVRSLYSQIEEGLLETITTEKGREQSIAGNVEGGLPGILKGRSSLEAGWNNRASETRTLHDHMFNVVETRLLGTPGFCDFGAQFADHWDRRQFSNRVSSVAYIRVTGQARLNNYRQMKSLMQDVHKLIENITSIQIDSDNKQLSQKQKSEKIRQATAGLPSEKSLKKVSDLVGLLFGDAIALKIWPIPSNGDCVFTCRLDENKLRDSISDLAFKFGAAPEDAWTCVGQIAKITSHIHADSSPQIGSQDDLEAGIDKVFDAIRGVVDLGTVKYPNISITPLAVYRG